jgi:hypothetical protein
MEVIMAVRKATRKDRSEAGKTTTDVVEQKVIASRGLVDAPGKRHRKPPPQESIDKRMGEPTGKQMGQKSFKLGMRRGRG